jgi:cyclic beta-1,2-glucan synthetase
VVRLLWPPFDATPRDPGYIKAYPPGIRENGGQYTHAAAWLGWAFADLGDRERAARILQLLHPVHRAASPAEAIRYGVEPYVMAADIGSVAPHAGRGGWTWYTGSAAWTWRFGIERILGLRLRNGDLGIDPCTARSRDPPPARWLQVPGASGGAVDVGAQDGLARTASRRFPAPSVLA